MNGLPEKPICLNNMHYMCIFLKKLQTAFMTQDAFPGNIFPDKTQLRQERTTPAQFRTFDGTNRQSSQHLTSFEVTKRYR